MQQSITQAFIKIMSDQAVNHINEIKEAEGCYSDHPHYINYFDTCNR